LKFSHVCKVLGKGLGLGKRWKNSGKRDIVVEFYLEKFVI